MRPVRIVRASVAVLAAAAAIDLGCGGDDTVGQRWAQAIDDERWRAACDLMVPQTRCEDRLRESYAGRDVELLRAGAYQEGANITDNETKFAVEAKAGATRSIAYYETERVRGRELVDVKISIEQP